MHELSLADGLIRQLVQLCREHGTQRVIQATVRIGPFSGVVTDSFAFGFDALKGEHAQTAYTELLLDTPCPTYLCHECGATFEQDGTAPVPLAPLSCPRCRASLCTPSGGEEIILQHLEME